MGGQKRLGLLRLLHHVHFLIRSSPRPILRIVPTRFYDCRIPQDANRLWFLFIDRMKLFQATDPMVILAPNSFAAAAQMPTSKVLYLGAVILFYIDVILAVFPRA
jgi:hypothetical protein